MKTTGKKQQKIGRKVGYMVSIMMTVSTIIVVGLCVWMFYSLVMKQLEDKCVTGTNVLSYELSRIPDGEDKTAMLDNLKNHMGMEFTIFEGDTRAYTTITQNGQRAVGTKLSSNVANIVLQQGKSYVGTTNILGVKHLCSYMPVKNANGQVTGLIFSGISASNATSSVMLVIGLAALVALISIVVCILILAACLSRKISVPLKKITQMAHHIEQGNLGLENGKNITVDVISNDEIGELSQAFGSTMSRLRAYIGEITQLLSAIAGGDLTKDAKQEYIGDFASLKTSLESIKTKLNETLFRIAESSNQVATGSDQVAHSAQSLAHGAIEQASTLQELSSTITEISNNAQKTANIAEKAGEFVQQAGAQLNVSIEHVGELNVAMEQISGSSEEISKIIDTIENIAFQTNILALNAAIEAARAGTSGKGFAVVADEVRNLAIKSDEAAKATKQLIDSSLHAVHVGRDAAEKVSASLEQTGQTASGVTSMMSMVVQAVDSQTTAISQVTEGIDQISGVVQTNSASSEECASASEELSTQANVLQKLLGSFRISRNSHK